MVIGATGTIGSAVAKALGEHEVVRVGSSSGDVRADISRPESIRELFAGVGQVDAVVSCAGGARFKPMAELGAAVVARAYLSSVHDGVNGTVIDPRRFA
jgi:nucleoside-diphosphate-sugar epimerase